MPGTEKQVTDAFVGDLGAFGELSYQQLASSLQNAVISITCKTCNNESSTMADYLQHTLSGCCQGRQQDQIIEENDMRTDSTDLSLGRSHGYVTMYYSCRHINL